MKSLPFFLLLVCCAPAYDPAVNAKLAQIQAQTINLKTQCPLTSNIIENELVLPALELQSMTKYRRSASDVNTEANDLYSEVHRFDLTVRHDPKPSVQYCVDKLDDVNLTIDTILKTYGVLK